MNILSQKVEETLVCMWCAQVHLLGKQAVPHCSDSAQIKDCGTLGNLVTPIYDNASSRNTFVWATSSISDKKAALNLQSPEVFTILPLMGIRKGGGVRGIFKGGY